MELRQYVTEAMTRARNMTVNSTKGLTEEQAYWQPMPQANSIAFLLWHISRAEDTFFSRWIGKGNTDVWASQGFDKKIKLPSAKPVNEWGSDELCQFSPALSDLQAYMEAVRKNSMAILAKMDMSKLGDHPVANHPDWTTATVLQLAIIHEASHQGAIDYLVGLMKARGIK